MKELFPGFAQEDFLLLHSVNFHVKGTNWNIFTAHCWIRL